MISILKNLFHKKEVRQHFCFWIASFLAITVCCLNMVQVVFVYSTEQTGIVELYYDSDNPEWVFQDDYKMQRRILRTSAGESKAAYFNVPFWRVNNLQMSVRGIRSVEVKDFYLDIPGQKNVDIADKLRSGLFVSENCRINSADPLILEFQKSDNKLRGMNLDLFWEAFLNVCSFSFVFSVIFSGIFAVVLTIYRRNGHSVSRSGFFRLFIVLCLALFSVFLMKSISTKNTDESTMIPTDHCQNDEPQERYTMHFTAAKGKIISLVVDSVTYTEWGGTVAYCITDQDTGAVLWNEEADVAELVCVGNLELDVSQLTFVENHDYVVEISFSNWTYYKLPQYEAGEAYVSVIYPFESKAKGYLFVLLFLTISCGLLFSFEKLELVRRAAIFGLISGLLLIFLIPPFSGSDEIRHLLRAYTLVEGEQSIVYHTENYVGSGDGQPLACAVVPRQMSDLRLIDDGVDHNNQSYQAERSKKVHWSRYKNVVQGNYGEETETISLWGVLNINFLCYLPQMLFIFLWNMFRLPAFGIVYAARMGNFLFSWLLCTLGVQCIPKKYRELVVVLCFIPGFLFLRCTCSLDGIVISAVIFFLSYVLYMAERGSALRWKNYLIMGATLFLIAIIKVPYVLVIFLLLLLRRENFIVITRQLEKVKRKRYTTVLGVAVSILIFLVGIFMGRYFLVRDMNLLDPAHVNYALQYPKRMIEMAWDFLILQTIPLFLEGITVNKNMMLAVAEGLCLLLACCVQKRKEMNVKCRRVFAITAALMILSMFAVGYYLMLPGTAEIDQIAGRYYLPIVPIIFMGQMYLGKRFAAMKAVLWDFVMGLSFISIMYIFYIFWI